MDNQPNEELPEEVVVSDSIQLPDASPGDVVVSEAVAVPVVPTQIANPSRASWRTAMFSIIAMLPVLNLAVISLQTVMSDYGYTQENLPGWFWAVLNGAVIVSGILAKWINSIALLPKINGWLTAKGIGPVPKASEN